MLSVDTGHDAFAAATGSIELGNAWPRLVSSCRQQPMVQRAKGNFARRFDVGRSCVFVRVQRDACKSFEGSLRTSAFFRCLRFTRPRASESFPTTAETKGLRVPIRFLGSTVDAPQTPGLRIADVGRGGRNPQRVTVWPGPAPSSKPIRAQPKSRWCA